MKNPYEVLGIPSSSSIDDVKRAYRDMARRYSSDPARMDSINNAYDMIINNFGNENAGSTYYSGNGGPYENQTSEFGDIRAKLKSGRTEDAEMLLDGVPMQRRNAEWYYLKGTILHRKGWLDSAAEYFEKAYYMEQDNAEYRAAYNELNREKNGGYRNRREDSEDNKGCFTPCNCCSSLICADCCCEAMGGDLIRCC
ncbi:MAG: molecular chaperone DnaJ [Clostridia bacterium]|nr:molecular chaperone DnaJ [Clostridia bacterium]